MAEFLLERGAPIGASTVNKGSTPLHIACQGGHIQLVQLLLSRGAVAAANDAQQWNSLHFACLNGHLELVEMLLEHGVAVTAPA